MSHPRNECNESVGDEGNEGSESIGDESMAVEWVEGVGGGGRVHLDKSEAVEIDISMANFIFVRGYPPDDFDHW